MRWIVGLLLVSAATLKAVHLVTEPTVALQAMRGSPDLALLGLFIAPLQAGAELVLGLVALNGTYWRQLRWIALLLFVGFAGYSLHLATSGATSCGCFGPLRVHPWWTFGLDLAVVFGLLVSIFAPRGLTEESNPCSDESKHDFRYPRMVVAAAMAVSVIVTAVLLRSVAFPTAAAEGVLQMAGGLVVLEPDKWLGKSFPIAEFIDLAQGSDTFLPTQEHEAQNNSFGKKVSDPLLLTDLMHGEWTVLLHRHDCPDCQEAIPKYEQLAMMGTRVALVEVPPFGDFRPNETACHYGRLTEKREWFVQTPVELKLRDGIVSLVTSPDH